MAVVIEVWMCTGKREAGSSRLILGSSPALDTVSSPLNHDFLYIFFLFLQVTDFIVLLNTRVQLLVDNSHLLSRWDITVILKCVSRHMGDPIFTPSYFVWVQVSEVVTTTRLFNCQVLTTLLHMVNSWLTFWSSSGPSQLSFFRWHLLIGSYDFCCCGDIILNLMTPTMAYVQEINMYRLSASRT